MSIVILGGNECMERRYKDLCDSYRCQSKIFTKPGCGLPKTLGSAEQVIVFASPMCYKLVEGAMSEIKGQNTVIERCHTSSLSALRGILEKHVGSPA